MPSCWSRPGKFGVCLLPRNGCDDSGTGVGVSGFMGRASEGGTAVRLEAATGELRRGRPRPPDSCASYEREGIDARSEAGIIGGVCGVAVSGFVRSCHPPFRPLGTRRCSAVSRRLGRFRPRTGTTMAWLVRLCLLRVVEVGQGDARQPLADVPLDAAVSDFSSAGETSTKASPSASRGGAADAVDVIVRHAAARRS